MSADDASTRTAVRVLCLDAYQRLLLLRRREQHRGAHFLAPPQYELDTSEVTPLVVGQLLSEATGLPAKTMTTRRAEFLARPYRLCTGEVHRELYFLARLAVPHELVPLALTAASDLVEGRWLAWHELLASVEPVRPPALADVLAALAPTGPWNPDPPWSVPVGEHWE